MKPRLPAAVLVMAILNFVFGGLGLVMSVCGGGLFLVMANVNLPAPQPGKPASMPNMAKIMVQEVPSYTAYMSAMLLAGLVMTTVLIVSGIGLLRLRPWARWLCLIYVPVQILLQIGHLYYTLTYVSPAMPRVNQEFMRQLPPGGPNLEMSSWVGNLSTFAASGLGIAYAIALLVVMMLPQVRAAFAGQSAQGQPGDELPVAP